MHPLVNRLRRILAVGDAGTAAPAPAEAPAHAAPVDAPSPVRQGYSAYGEDVIVLSWLGHYGIAPASVRYLDIGAAHPWRINNTYLLYAMGASGVLVEPDPDQAETLRQVRDRDTVIEAGVAFDDQRAARYYRMTSPVFNSFSEEQAEFARRSSEGWDPSQRQEVREVIEVPLRPVNEILEAHFAPHAPDFISIDVESKDVDILRMIDFARFRPLMICVEATRYREVIDTILAPFGYEQMANTPDNFLFMLSPYDPAWTERAARR